MEDGRSDEVANCSVAFCCVSVFFGAERCCKKKQCERIVLGSLVTEFRTNSSILSHLPLSSHVCSVSHGILKTLHEYALNIGSSCAACFTLRWIICKRCCCVPFCDVWALGVFGVSMWLSLSLLLLHPSKNPKTIQTSLWWSLDRSMPFF